MDGVSPAAKNKDPSIIILELPVLTRMDPCNLADLQNLLFF
jgi:hypothetical protein